MQNHCPCPLRVFGIDDGCLLCFCLFDFALDASSSCARNVLEPPSASASMCWSVSSVSTTVVWTAKRPCMCCRVLSKALSSSDSVLPSSLHTDINMLSPAIPSAQFFLWTVGASAPGCMPLHNDKSVCWFARASSLCLVTAAMASATYSSSFCAAIALSCAASKDVWSFFLT